MPSLETDRNEAVMNFYDVVAVCAKKSDMSTNKISYALGHSTNYLRNLKSMKRDTAVSNAARILDACGYALCAVPKDKVADDMLEITPR